MQNKLQVLTDRLYNEGLARGKQDAETLLEEARKKSSDIISEAKDEAAKIIESARREAEALRTKTEGDIKMASSQVMQQLRQQIEKLVTSSAVDAPVRGALSDSDYVSELIVSVVNAFNPAEGLAVPLEVILPKSIKDATENTVAKALSSAVAKGVEFSATDRFDGGFRVAPKGEGYFVDFTDESFTALISEYLRPATAKILFGK
mgnify:CR=1 FL=1